MINHSNEARNEERFEHIADILAELKTEIRRFENEAHSLTLTEPEFHEFENVIKEATALIKKLRTKATLRQLGQYYKKD